MTMEFCSICDEPIVRGQLIIKDPPNPFYPDEDYDPNLRHMVCDAQIADGDALNNEHGG